MRITSGFRLLASKIASRPEAGLADRLDVVLAAEQKRDPRADNGVVVDDQDLDRLRHASLTLITAGDGIRRNPQPTRGLSRMAGARLRAYRAVHDARHSRSSGHCTAKRHTGKLEVTKERIELTSRGYTFAFPRDSVIQFVVERGAEARIRGLAVAHDSPRRRARRADREPRRRGLVARDLRAPRGSGPAGAPQSGARRRGYLSGDRRPGSRRGLDFERPADEREPLSHAEQAERILDAPRRCRSRGRRRRSSQRRVPRGSRSRC